MLKLHKVSQKLVRVLGKKANSHIMKREIVKEEVLCPIFLKKFWKTQESKTKINNYYIKKLSRNIRKGYGLECCFMSYLLLLFFIYLKHNAIRVFPVKFSIYFFKQQNSIVTIMRMYMDKTLKNQTKMNIYKSKMGEDFLKQFWLIYIWNKRKIPKVREPY